MSKRAKIDTTRCYFCARQRGIDAHHIVPDRFNGKETRENLVGVCERCHKKLERIYDKRFYEQIGITDSKGERKNHFPCLIGECTNSADVKLAHRAGSDWYCERHATERYASKSHIQLVEDTAGTFDTRVRWIDAMQTKQPVDVIL